MSATEEQKQIMKNGEIAGASRALYALTESILRDHGECEARDALIAAALDAGVMPLLKERVARMTTPKRPCTVIRAGWSKNVQASE